MPERTKADEQNEVGEPWRGRDEPAAFARRELKQGFDDGLFAEGDRTLADEDDDDTPSWREENAALEDDDWDADDPLRIDEGGRAAS